MDGSKLIVSIIEAVIQDTEHTSDWPNQLEKYIATNFKGNDYISRVRIIISKIKKHGAILVSISPERLAIMPINYINAYIEYNKVYRI